MLLRNFERIKSALVQITGVICFFLLLANCINAYGNNSLLFIGADHKGFQLKQSLTLELKNAWHLIDLGANSKEAVDYPDYAQKVAEAVQKNPGSFGILICNTGTGMAIAANRFKGIRAIICYTPEDAITARRHYNANILVISSSKTELPLALELVQKFTSTEFEPGKDGKSKRRVEKLDKLS